MVNVNESPWYWLPHPTDGFIAAQLIAHDTASHTATLQSQHCEHFIVPHHSLASLAPVALSSLSLSVSDTNNLTDVEELSEGCIVSALRHRYDSDAIYTNINTILLSINPYKQLPCYGPHTMRTFHSVMTGGSDSGGAVPPHIYALAHGAYHSLTVTGRAQSVIIAGESGAGKTEATKLCLQYLAEVSGVGDAIEQQILEANPIIEAFGNSRTVKNNNSSRFGKFIKVQFNDRYKINGATIQAYLLEKSRVCVQSEGETNFHIFYALCNESSDDERQRYHLLPASAYKILRACDRSEIPLKEVKRSLTILSFTEQQQDALWRVLSAVLRIGNLIFAESGKGYSVDDSELAIIASLLYIDSEKLKAALLTRRLLVGGEVIVQVHRYEQCVEMQQSLCKAFYSSMFAFLIDHINQTLKPKTGADTSSTGRWIGVLDIFGFENFPSNHWEQFCINYANEKLQQQFVSICLSMEQTEYRNEGLPHNTVDFVDNQQCLDLIEAKRSGVIDMISEEIKLPKGSDKNLLQRMHQALADAKTGNTHYIKPKTAAPTFGVRHYAGDVTYEIDGMCEKNKGDALSEDVYEALDSATNDWMRELLYWGKKELAAPLPTASPAPERKPSTGTSATSHSRGTSRGAIPTQGSFFRSQLADLMLTLNQTDPHFLKCLKPNGEKIPDHFDGNFVLRQLNYLGVKEVIQVRKSGFPVRIKRQDFIKRFRLLINDGAISASSGSDDDGKEVVRQMLDALTVDPALWFNGKTKVLLKPAVQSMLEESREARLSKSIVRIQTRYRCRLLQRKYRAIKQCARELEAALSKSDAQSLDELDSLIEHATDLDLPTTMLASAKQTRHRLWQSLQCRNELIASIKSKDRSVIEAAISKAAAVESLSQCSELKEAREWISKHDKYLSDINRAIKARELAALESCLAFARSLSLDSPLEQTASELCRTLHAEQVLTSRLQSLIQSQSTSINEYELLLLEANQLHFNSVLVSEARSTIESLKAEQKKREQAALAKLSAQAKIADELINRLQAARDSFTVPSMRAALADIDKQDAEIIANVKANALYSKCQSLVSEINQFEVECLSAMKAKDSHTLCVLISQAQSHRWDSLPLVNQAQSCVKQLERDGELRLLLANAIESRQANVLTAAIDKAEKRAAQRKEAGEAHEADDAQLIKAKSLLNEIESETRMHEQDVVASRPASERRRSLVEVQSPAVQPKPVPQPTRAESGALTTSNTVLKSRAPFLSAPFLSPSLALHLCPLLRSPDDFAKGKWLAKSAMKKGMLTHTKEAITRSLINLDGIAPQAATKNIINGHSEDSLVTSDNVDDLNTIAVSLFKSMQGWMGDRAYSFPDSLAHDVLSLGVKEVELREEIYFQCMKQLRDNPKSDSCVKGWQLIGLCSECFRPSPVALPYVYNFLLTTPHREDPLMLGYINYTMHCLHHREPTLKAPSLTHITSYRDRLMNTAILPLHFTDGSVIDVEVSPEITVAGVMKRVKQWLGVITADTDNDGDDDDDDNVDGLAIYQIGPGTVELCIGSDECLLDYPASQSMDADGSLTFVLKKRFFTPATSNFATLHPMIMSLIYHQCIRDACYGVYDLQRSELIEILAIHRRLRSSSPFQPIGRATSLSDSIADIKPLVFSYWDNRAIAAFEREVDQVVDQHVQASKPASPTLVFDILRKRKEFSSLLFLVSQDERTELPHSLLIAVNTFGICLINETSKQLISAFKFQHITGWASNSVRFCLRVLVAKGKTVQLNFKTEKGKRIVRAIQENVEVVLKEQQRLKAGGGKEAEESKEQQADQPGYSTLRGETIIQVL